MKLRQGIRKYPKRANTLRSTFNIAVTTTGTSRNDYRRAPALPLQSGYAWQLAHHPAENPLSRAKHPVSTYLSARSGKLSAGTGRASVW